MQLLTPSVCVQVGVSTSVRELCHKLAELGWLYRKVRNFIDSKGRDKARGLVCQVRTLRPWTDICTHLFVGPQKMTQNQRL